MSYDKLLVVYPGFHQVPDLINPICQSAGIQKNTVLTYLKFSNKNRVNILTFNSLNIYLN